jgi:hypothetical protein
MRTLPDLLTATIITRGFLFSGGELGGAGVDGCAASSMMRTWVMYDSTTVAVELVSLNVQNADSRRKSHVSAQGYCFRGTRKQQTANNPRTPFSIGVVCSNKQIGAQR